MVHTTFDVTGGLRVTARPARENTRLHRAHAPPARDGYRAACAPGVTWSFDGSWDVELIVGTAEITLPDGSEAATDVVARKRPRV